MRTAEQWLAIPEQDLLVKLAEVLPGLQKIDWNTAMEWFRKTKPKRSIIRKICGPAWQDEMTWLVAEAQPKHYLIVAAMCVERKEE